MSVENFLKDVVDTDVINHYLRLLAERQLQAEQTNRDVNNCLQLSKQALLKTEQQETQIKQLTTQINAINTELNQLRQRSKVIENRIESFIVRSDGTASDTVTGLMWCRYSIGQQWKNGFVMGDAIKMDWYEAMKIADFFNEQDVCGGFTDWRLPSFEELKSLVEKDKSPSINQAVFPNTPREVFWSSSIATINNLAWFVYFGSGSINCTAKNSNYAVRLVR